MSRVVSQLTSNEIIKVEGYIEALIDNRKIKEEQKLSSQIFLKINPNKIFIVI